MIEFQLINKRIWGLFVDNELFSYIHKTPELWCAQFDNNVIYDSDLRSLKQITLNHFQENHNLIKFIKDFCKTNKIKLDLSYTDYLAYPGSGGPVSGYFVVKNNIPKLGVALNAEDWKATILHEMCHAMQWKEKADVWTNNLLTEKEKELFGFEEKYVEAIDALDVWLDNTVYDNYINEITDLTNRTIAVELDCEKRTVLLAPKYIHNFDTDLYIKKANAYCRFYKYVEEFKEWNAAGYPSYTDQKVLDFMSNKFDLDYFSPLNHKEREVFCDFVERSKKAGRN